jgi:hypothetical protein
MSKKVSLKKIIEEIDKALEALDAAEPPKLATDYDLERAKKSLKAVRETVQAVCYPNFDLPVA